MALPVADAHRLSDDVDHDLAFGPACFHIRQSAIGFRKRKDTVHYRADHARIDERSYLTQLISVRSHEQKRVVDVEPPGSPLDSPTQKSHHCFHEPADADFFAKLRIWGTRDRNEFPTWAKHSKRFLKGLCVLAVQYHIVILQDGFKVILPVVDHDICPQLLHQIDICRACRCGDRCAQMFRQLYRDGNLFRQSEDLSDNLANDRSCSRISRTASFRCRSEDPLAIVCCQCYHAGCSTLKLSSSVNRFASRYPWLERRVGDQDSFTSGVCQGDGNA